MQLTPQRLTQEKLSTLGQEFVLLVQSIHRFCWKEECSNLIKIMENFNPDWDDKDIFERVGNSWIDWEMQEAQDNKDWKIAFNTIAQNNQLNRQQLQQFRKYIEED